MGTYVLHEHLFDCQGEVSLGCRSGSGRPETDPFRGEGRSLSLELSQWLYWLTGLALRDGIRHGDDDEAEGADEGSPLYACLVGEARVHVHLRDYLSQILEMDRMAPTRLASRTTPYPAPVIPAKANPKMLVVTQVRQALQQTVAMGAFSPYFPAA